jgi:membrane protein DedA with SNARE-associated domain
MLVSATAGSTLGFVAMYIVGQRYGTRIIDSGKFSFLPKDAVSKSEAWFKHYGFWVIIANRFLSGTRAVISMVAGISGLPLGTTTLLSALSAGVWNGILLFAGFTLGKNWLRMDEYLQLYGKVLLGVAAGIIVVIIGFRAWQKRKK